MWTSKQIGGFIVVVLVLALIESAIEGNSARHALMRALFVFAAIGLIIGAVSLYVKVIELLDGIKGQKKTDQKEDSRK